MWGFRRQCSETKSSNNSREESPDLLNCHLNSKRLLGVPSSTFYTTSNYSPVTARAKQENNLTALQLAKKEQQLHEAQGKIWLLNQKLVEKAEELEEAKLDLQNLSIKLQREKEISAELSQKVKILEQKMAHCDCESLLDDLDQSAEKLELHLRRCSVTPISNLMLSCTLCSTKIKMEELESHSVKCSAGTLKRSSSKDGLTFPGILVATVTFSRRDSTSHNNNPNMKVICKTTIRDFSKQLLTSERTKEDFAWFRQALEDLHPECVIPPLSLHEDATATLREVQRFLSRICVHQVLKNDSLVRKFFESTNKELEKLKKSVQKRMPVHLKHKKPAIEVVDKDGLLYKTQVYISGLIENLTSLIEFFKTNRDDKSFDGLSKCFMELSDSETNDTYLKNVAQSLSTIISKLESNNDVIYDESVLAEDLESILEFVKCADKLLLRIECSVNTFLYWEEEIRVFEEMKTEGLVTSSNGKDITQLWAEASSYCRTAKDELEKMCRNLSEELTEFDIRKEQELKQIFMEYAESRSDVFEKMQSKWFGVKLILDIGILPDKRSVNFNST